MPTEPQAQASPELAYVQRALTESRFRNAVVVAWLRLALRAAIVLGVLGYAAVGGPPRGVEPRTSLLLSAAHVAVGLLVLWRLRRRPSELWVGVGAASDFLTVGLGAWLAVTRPGGAPELTASYFAAALMLLLLMTALTARRRTLAPIAVAAVAFQALLVWRAGFNLADSVVVTSTLAAFGFAVTTTGSRLVDMAVRAALEARAGDLSRRHALELSAAKAALEAAREQADELTALIVHDIRNPLASASMNLEEVRARLREPSPEVRTSLEVALEELGRLSGMTGDLLLVSSIEEGLSPQPAEVAVGPLLATVARTLGPLVARAGASLTVVAPEGLTARLDERLVRRLLDNLVVNACRHVGEGDRVELAAGVDGGRLRLAVRNSGPPVPPEVRPRLFDKHFTQGRRHWHNAGLGLHLCRLVAHLHGGGIALVERPGWGASFETEWPLEAGVTAREVVDRG
jgi:signal transduction histidine kinase